MIDSLSFSNSAQIAYAKVDPPPQDTRMYWKSNPIVTKSSLLHGLNDELPIKSSLMYLQYLKSAYETNDKSVFQSAFELSVGCCSKKLSWLEYFL
jgi:hypothetical protein